MARRTRTFLITAVAAAAALIPAAGASAGTLDQQQTLSNFGGLQVDSSHSKAQTFTAGLTGQLDQVDLALSGMSVTTPLTVQIRDGSATAPGNTVLASASVPTSAVTSSESFVPITFASPASVTAGTQYSIVALNDSPLSPAGSGTRDRGRRPIRPMRAGGSMPARMAPRRRAPGPKAHLPTSSSRPTSRRPPPPPGTGGGSGGSGTSATGERAAALKKCKKKRAQTAKRKCRKKANRLPV